MKSFYQVLYRSAVIVAALCSGSLLLGEHGEPRWANDYELRVAFVYNVARFVDWPQGVLGDRLVIGVLDEGPMMSVMVTFFADKHIGTRAIDVRAVRSRVEIRSCNILLVSYSDSSRMRESLEQVQGMNVLTVGNGEQFVQLGGIVALAPRENTYKLFINPQAAERAHLKVSSKLLNLASLASDGETAVKSSK
jgi:hypothetical protein